MNVNISICLPPSVQSGNVEFIPGTVGTVCMTGTPPSIGFVPSAIAGFIMADGGDNIPDIVEGGGGDIIPPMGNENDELGCKSGFG